MQGLGYGELFEIYIGVVSMCVSACVSTCVSTSSIVGIVVLIVFSKFSFILSSVIGDGTSSMTIGSTTLPGRNYNSLDGMGLIE